MKPILFSTLFFLFTLTSFSQSKYSMVGGVETPYKEQYTFKVRLDEVNKKLIFETNAPVTVVTLETYTQEEILAHKGIEYTNTYFKTGNIYSYDLNKPLLKDKQAYWLKVSIGNNGVPLAEYYFKRNQIAPQEQVEEKNTDPGDEIKGADGATIINTNIKCTAGKTKVIAALKKLEGVFDVKINIATGKLVIKYSSDGTPYTTILYTINENGFETNGHPSTNISANPCVKKTSN